MPFSPNDSVDVLIRARAAGQQEIDALRGSVEKISGAERAHLDILNKLDGTLKNVVSGVDSLTKALESQNSGVNRNRQSLDEWEKRMNAIVSNPAYSINSPFSVLGRAAQQAAMSMGTMGTVALGASVGVGVLAAGAVSLVNTMGESARELQNFALRLGLSVDQAQRLQIAAKITGVEITTLEGAARTLGNALADGAGSGKKQVDALNQLGVATHTISGEQREMGEVLLDVLDKLSKLGSAAEKAHLGTVLLNRSSKEILPLVDSYAEATAAADKLAQMLGTNVNEQLVAGKKAISEMDSAWELFKKNLAAKIEPVVIPILMTVTGFLTSPQTNQKQANLPKGAFDFSDLQKPTQAGLNPADKAKSESLVAHFDSLEGKTKEGYEKVIKTAREKQAELNNIIHGIGVGPDAVGKAIGEFNTEQKKIDSAQAGLQGLTDAKEAARHLKTLIADWTKKRDESNAQLLVNPETRTKFDEINEEQRNALGENPNNKQLQGLINDTFASKWAKEYNSDIAKANKETETLNEKWEKLSILGGKLAQRPWKDFFADFEKETKQRADEIIADLRGVERTQRSDRNERFRMQSRFNLKMDDLQGNPADEMNRFMNSQAEAKIEAFMNLQESLKAAEGQKDQHTQEAQAYLQYARETWQLELDTTLKVAEIRKQQLEEDRKFLGEVFDAMDSGKRGAVGKLLKNEVVGFERTLFQNAFQQPLQAVRTSITGYLNPFEKDANGNANLLGKLLQATPFGINQASPEIKSRDANTAAIDNLTAAISKLGGTGAGGTLNYTPVLGSIGSTASSIAPGAAGFSSLATALSKIFSGGNKPDDLTAQMNSLSFGPNEDGTMGAYFAPAASSAKTSLGKGLSIGAAIAAGATAVYAGIRQGGAQGTETAIAGGLGALSAIPGPQQPFVAAAAAITSLVSMFTGMSVEQRYKQMENNVAGSYDRLPVSQYEQFDISGAQSDITSPGHARVVGNVNINVTAFDSKSIIDNWQPIATAIHTALNQNHPVRDTIKQAVR